MFNDQHIKINFTNWIYAHTLQKKKRGKKTRITGKKYKKTRSTLFLVTGQEKKRALTELPKKTTKENRGSIQYYSDA